MKKIYRFAIAAAAVCVMVSCGNKGSEKAADAQEAEAQEQIEEEAAPDPDVLTEAKTLEGKAFSITAPAGWWVSTETDEDISFMLPCETGNCKNISAMISGSSVEDANETSSYEGFVEQDKVTLNGVEYSVITKEENHMTIYRTPVGEGHLGIYVQNVEDGDEEVQAVLESITLK